eukprot:m.138904 g.138904  ORF g.138904 m.138904 type:complete len:57 (+) comp16642_c0_seq6:410-580(+)
METLRQFFSFYSHIQTHNHIPFPFHSQRSSFDFPLLLLPPRFVSVCGRFFASSSAF